MRVVRALNTQIRGLTLLRLPAGGMGPKLGNHVRPGVEESLADVLQRLVRMAEKEPSPKVRLTLASQLQRLPIPDRTELGLVLASHAKDADDEYIPLMLWYGLEQTIAYRTERAFGILDVPEDFSALAGIRRPAQSAL